MSESKLPIWFSSSTTWKTKYVCVYKFIYSIYSSFKVLFLVFFGLCEIYYSNGLMYKCEQLIYSFKHYLLNEEFLPS